MGKLTDHYLSVDYKQRRRVKDLSTDELLAEMKELDTAEYELRNLIDDGRPKPEGEARPSAADATKLTDRLADATLRLEPIRNELRQRKAI